MRRPNLFIAGAPKSGTTSLYEYLRGHPDVFMSAVKEPFYFSPDVVIGPRQRLHRPDDHDAYMALFEGAKDERWVGEASTSYLASVVAPRLVHDFEPEARIVAMLQNPVEMLYALHNEGVSHGVEPIEDFEQALTTNASGAIYMQNARYGEQIARWFDVFGRDRVHVIVFDEFAADTPASFRRLLEFLEVGPDYEPSEFGVHNPSHRMRRGVVKRMVESRHARWAVRSLLPRVIGADATARLTRRFRHSRLRRESRERPPLPTPLRLRLERELADDVARLGQLLDRDLEALWFAARNKR